MNKRIKKKIAKSIRGFNRCTVNRLDTLLSRTKKSMIGPIAFAPTTKYPKKLDYVEIKVVAWDITHYTTYSQFTVIATNVSKKRNPKKKYPGNYAVYNYGDFAVVTDLHRNIEYTINFGDQRIMYGALGEKSVFDNAVFVYGEKIQDDTPDKLRFNLKKIVESAMNNEEERI